MGVSPDSRTVLSEIMGCAVSGESSWVSSCLAMPPYHAARRRGRRPALLMLISTACCACGRRVPVCDRALAGWRYVQGRRATGSIVQLRLRVALWMRFGEVVRAQLATIWNAAPGASSEADGSHVARYPGRISRSQSVGSGAQVPLRSHQGLDGPTPCPTSGRPIPLYLPPSCARCRDHPRCPRSRLARTTFSWFLSWSVPSSPCSWALPRSQTTASRPCLL